MTGNANFSLTMSNTSQKHRNFVSEPMGDKPVTALPGIGPTLGRELQREGINKVQKTHGNTVSDQMGSDLMCGGGFFHLHQRGWSDQVVCQQDSSSLEVSHLKLNQNSQTNPDPDPGCGSSVHAWHGGVQWKC
uniref:Barrier to autointegration factor 1 n=1 Tax=Amphilophus citrinellus TaxID=61819 RepID=A0A3Q0S696_AMPCI